jgi:glutamate-1-semialdehyde 2,1-aminomutase
MRATLINVLGDSDWPKMTDVATRFREGVEAAIEKYGVAWSCTQLGTRVEYRFASPAPINGSASAAAGDSELEDYMHLYCINRGVMITPFHNMALMCRNTSVEDVDLHTEVFTNAVRELVGK